MGFFKGLGLLVAGAVGVGLLAKGLSKSQEEQQKALELEKKRQNTPCLFNDGISQNEFSEIAKRKAKKIKRISSISISGTILHGTVQSQSGISTWAFQLDFNDFGHLTGKYWHCSENRDSDIPKSLGNQIEEEIKTRMNNPFE